MAELIAHFRTSLASKLGRIRLPEDPGCHSTPNFPIAKSLPNNFRYPETTPFGLGEDEVRVMNGVNGIHEIQVQVPGVGCLGSGGHELRARCLGSRASGVRWRGYGGTALEVGPDFGDAAVQVG